MKQKIVAAVLYLIVVVMAAATFPVPAGACWNVCGHYPCRYGTLAFTRYNSSTIDDYVLLESPFCLSGTGQQLYFDCSQYPCSRMGTGVLFHIENDYVSIFTVRNRQEDEQIKQAIYREGIEKVVKEYSAKTIAAKDFDNWNGEYLRQLESK